MPKVNLSSPWVELYREFEVLFGGDPDVNVVYDENSYSIKLYVNDMEKAEALTQLLPPERTFGNVVSKIEVISANNDEPTMVELFQKAFDGNPAFKYIASVPECVGFPITYVVFRNEVVQYFNDDLGDINGNRSTLYQEIAKDIFEDHNGIHFCTEEPEKAVVME